MYRIETKKESINCNTLKELRIELNKLSINNIDSIINLIDKNGIIKRTNLKVFLTD